MEERKLDALDFVLNVLREHEESLDTLIERLDLLMEDFSKIQHRLESICEKVEQIAQSVDSFPLLLSMPIEPKHAFPPSKPF
jgi:uncharacterized membrane protein